MSISISGGIGGGGGISVETDPTALKKASNLADLTNLDSAKETLGLNSIDDASCIDIPVTSNSGWAFSSSPNGFYLSGGVFGTKIIGPTGSGFAQYTADSYLLQKVGTPTNLSWNKKFVWSFRLVIHTGDSANVRMKVQLGTAGGMALGIQKWGNQTVALFAHDGTTERSFLGSFNPVLEMPFDCRIEADGLGNAQLYINNTLSVSTTQAPTGTSGNRIQIAGYANTTIVSPNNIQFTISNMRMKFYD